MTDRTWDEADLDEVREAGHEAALDIDDPLAAAAWAEAIEYTYTYLMEDRADD